MEIGTDIEKISRFENLDKKLIKKIYSEKEFLYCKKARKSSQSFAGKFCAKEAIIKALGTDLEMRDIEIINTKEGPIEVSINGKKRNDIKCSISHCDEYALAFVVIA